MAYARAQFPSGPMIDVSTGEVMPSWRGFFLALYQRTGGTLGVAASDGTAMTTGLAQEIIDRREADTTLNAAIAAEAATRAQVALGLQQEITSHLTNNDSRTTQLTTQLQTQGGTLAAEVLARKAGDATNAAAITAEATARSAAVSAEASARASADAQLVPIAGLAARIAALAFDVVLPTSDPGGGRLWLNDVVVQIGTAGGAGLVGQEDGVGDWLLEDGSGAWQWA